MSTRLSFFLSLLTLAGCANGTPLVPAEDNWPSCHSPSQELAFEPHDNLPGVIRDAATLGTEPWRPGKYLCRLSRIELSAEGGGFGGPDVLFGFGLRPWEGDAVAGAFEVCIDPGLWTRLTSSDWPEVLPAIVELRPSDRGHPVVTSIQPVTAGDLLENPTAGRQRHD